ncbi:hypothetical protein B0H13DRAFT_867279 [Mycena leptocephala]|nr:hypothetical protein B0H13DRAFT_867279 [Mycena leptocephala]
MRAFVEARGGEEESGRTGTGVGAHGGRGSPCTYIGSGGWMCRRRPSPLCTVIPGLPLNSYIRRCNISKQAQLPRRCILLGFYLSLFVYFFLFSLLHPWLVAPGVAGFCCYIAGHSSVYLDAVFVHRASAPSAVWVATGCRAPMGIRKHRTMINCPNDRFAFASVCTWDDGRATC